MSKYFYRIFTIIDLHFGAMQPCSSGLGMTLEASDFTSVRRLVAYSIYLCDCCFLVSSVFIFEYILETSNSFSQTIAKKHFICIVVQNYLRN